MASLVTTTPARSAMASSNGWKQVISFVFSCTSSWARTRPVVWSRAASRWILRPLALAAPRRLLPSTARPRSRPRVRWRRSASQRPTARSNASPSIRASSRRTVVSAGRHRLGNRGSNRTPTCSSTWGGASVIHSPTASSDVAPASTAQATRARTPTRAWRTPRGSRGSGTWARRPSSPGTSSGAASGCSRSWSRAGGISDDASAGTVFQAGHGASRTP